MRGLFHGIRRFILWDYPRACWQYDVMVGLILAFIFLSPKAWFRDQPRASNVVVLEASQGAQVIWIAPELLSDLPDSQKKSGAEQVLKTRFGKPMNLLQLETIRNAESEIDGYVALAKP